MNRKEMMEKNINLAYSFCHKYNINDEDKKQEVMYAYCKAVNTYDKNRGALSTYAYSVIYHHLERIKRLGNMKKRTFPEGTKWFSLNQVCVKHDAYLDDITYYEDMIGYDDNAFGEVLENITLKRVMSNLTEKQYKVVKSMLSGRTRNETAKLLGSSSQAVTDILLRIKDNFIKEIQDEQA